MVVGTCSKSIVSVWCWVGRWRVLRWVDMVGGGVCWGREGGKGFVGGVGGWGGLWRVLRL